MWYNCLSTTSWENGQMNISVKKGTDLYFITFINEHGNMVNEYLTIEEVARIQYDERIPSWLGTEMVRDGEKDFIFDKDIEKIRKYAINNGLVRKEDLGETECP